MARFVAVAVEVDHLGSVVAGGGQLERRGILGHEDDRADIVQGGGEGDCLGVVARGVGGNAAEVAGVVEPGDSVVGAPEFERPAPLEALCLEEHLGPDPVR